MDDLGLLGILEAFLTAPVIEKVSGIILLNIDYLFEDSYQRFPQHQT